MSSTEATPEGGSPSIEIEEVLARIPHRHPFVLVDRAVDYVAFKSIRGIKAVTYNEPFFPGHFPGAPVMPGVLMIEAMGQTGAVLMSKSLEVDATKNTILFMGIDNARFRRPVRPGELIEMPVEVMFYRRNIFKFKGRCEVNGELAAEAEFAAMKVER
ncbi:MAG: 3-hydroxyacyl-ACP dehydratase FabZ [Hyphomonadaceae bacterium]|nr:3-hydroxyacyl-ACP dehydratase FabZ [Hyphomonadaceae bacterium]